MEPQNTSNMTTHPKVERAFNQALRLARAINKHTSNRLHGKWRMKLDEALKLRMKYMHY